MTNTRTTLLTRIAAAAWIALAPAVAFAAGYAPFTQQGPLYAPKEASLDIFGSYLAAEKQITDVFKTNIRGGAWGGGIGLNYFASANFGFGTDINIPDNSGRFIDTYTINLIYRYPIESIGLAPYIIGGGGRAYDPKSEWIAQVGLGLEYRSSHKAGIFVDGRYEWFMNTTPDKLELRAGLRFVF
jgi:hypothetical protein